MPFGVGHQDHSTCDRADCDEAILIMGGFNFYFIPGVGIAFLGGGNSALHVSTATQN